MPPDKPIPNWPSTKAKRALAAVLRIGWRIKRQSAPLWGPFDANIAASGLAAGTGITVVDPHGGLSDELLTNHIPRRRKNDVIFFDSKDRTHTLALNVLDCPRPEEQGLVVSHG